MFVWTIAALCLYGFKLVHAHILSVIPNHVVPNLLCRFFQNLKIVTKVLTNPLNMLLTLKPLSTGYPNYKHTNALSPLKWMLPCIWLCGKSVYGGRGMHWRGMVAEVWWQRSLAEVYIVILNVGAKHMDVYQ